MTKRNYKKPAPMTEEEELNEAFNEWFIHSLYQQTSCLYRDVLRDCRAQLKAAFMERRPIWTTAEVTKAKDEANKLEEILMNE